MASVSEFIDDQQQQRTAIVPIATFLQMIENALAATKTCGGGSGSRVWKSLNGTSDACLCAELACREPSLRVDGMCN